MNAQTTETRVCRYYVDFRDLNTGLKLCKAVYAKREDIKEALADAGFTNVNIHRVERSL